MILEQAFKITQEQGIAAVTSRSVAKELGCSIQPVFSQFPTMEELRRATFAYTCELLVRELLSFEKSPDFFIEAVKWVVDLAKDRPELFRLVFLSGEYYGKDSNGVMTSFESNRIMVAKMMEIFCLEEAVCKDILLRGLLFLMGICTVICADPARFSQDQVIAMMKKTVSDMVIGAKSNGGLL